MFNKNQIAESFATFSDNELISLNEAIAKEITRRKEEEEQKKNRLIEERERLVNSMNLMLRQFREIAGKLNKLKEEHIDCYVQYGHGTPQKYLAYGDVECPFYGFTVDCDGDLMVVCDINHPRAKWWRDELAANEAKIKE